MTAERLADDIAGWLDTVTYPDAPSTDGHARRGYRLRSGDISLSVFTVEPYWIVYGK